MESLPPKQTPFDLLKQLGHYMLDQMHYGSPQTVIPKPPEHSELYADWERDYGSQPKS